MDLQWHPGLENLRSVLKLDFYSVIDIIIVAFVVYKLMMLIKGTRAVQLIKGLVVLIVATALSSIFNLHTINWLLKQAMTALVVALPVVFQPELRRALEKLGRGQLFSPSFSAGTLESEELSKTIAIITEASKRLAKEKVGALIVIERETGLEEHVDTGIKIDGIVSVEILTNIFIENTPLHDGALIMRGNRVAAAACFLPLSENPDIPGELGSRHRAAIGISEHSDAITVVVSEETGTISLAVESVLSRGFDEFSLKEQLTAYLSKKPGRSLASLWSRRQRHEN